MSGDPTAQRLEGTTIAHFRIEARLGEGGMGVVYRATDEGLRRPVALKLMLAKVAGDAGRRARFLREARAAAAVSHAGIATIYEVGEADGRIFIAMELVEGRTLRRLLEDGRLPLDDALKIGRDIARALVSAHERGVIHRDLKPENVMLTAEGEVKVLDFGVAKLARDADAADLTESLQTAEGKLLGTPAYMSPEQIKGPAVDPRTDLFSFGVLLYELVTGARPFAGAGAVELAVAVLHDEPAPASRSNPQVSPPLAQLIARCLAKRREERPATAREVADELDRLIGPTSGERTPIDGAAPVRRARRRPRRLAVAAALAAVAAIGVMTAAWLLSRAEREQAAGATIGGRGIAITELPPPDTSEPEARALFLDAQAEYRAGGWRYTGLMRALEIDPRFPAAHLYLAWIASFDTEQARAHLEKARLGHARLSARDQAFLWAIEPLIASEPPDAATTAGRLDEVLGRQPRDAELTLARATVARLLAPEAGEAPEAPMRRAIEEARRSLALDPEFAQPHGLIAFHLLALGELDTAAAEAEACVASWPAAAECWRALLQVYALRGRCDRVEQAARSFIGANPSNPRAYLEAARAAFALGRPAEAVAELLRQHAERLPGATGERAALADRVAIDLVRDGFVEAERGWRALVERGSAVERAAAAIGLAELLIEQGRDAEAGRVAAEALALGDAISSQREIDYLGVAREPTWALLALAHRGGAMPRAELLDRRAELLALWSRRTQPFHRRYLWPAALARAAVDSDGAREALAALPAYLPLPAVLPTASLDADVGRTYLLAGRPAEALPWLERASAACAALADPIADTRAHLHLGAARGALGDRDGACRAFAVVLARWGRANPMSATADEVRRRARALGCAH